MLSALPPATTGIPQTRSAPRNCHCAAVGFGFLSCRPPDRLREVVDCKDVLMPARRLADDGLKAWAQGIERGYEGLVAKDPASPYRGGRTLARLKVKVPHYREGHRGWEAKPSDRG